MHLKKKKKQKEGNFLLDISASLGVSVSVCWLYWKKQSWLLLGLQSQRSRKNVIQRELIVNNMISWMDSDSCYYRWCYKMQQGHSLRARALVEFATMVIKKIIFWLKADQIWSEHKAHTSL